MLGVSVQGHVELDYRSEAFCVNSLSITMDAGSSGCCQSATVASGEDLPLAAAAIHDNVLLQQTGQ